MLCCYIFHPYYIIILLSHPNPPAPAQQQQAKSTASILKCVLNWIVCAAAFVCLYSLCYYYKYYHILFTIYRSLTYTCSRILPPAACIHTKKDRALLRVGVVVIIIIIGNIFYGARGLLSPFSSIHHHHDIKQHNIQQTYINSFVRYVGRFALLNFVRSAHLK